MFVDVLRRKLLISMPIIHITELRNTEGILYNSLFLIHSKRNGKKINAFFRCYETRDCLFTWKFCKESI